MCDEFELHKFYLYFKKRILVHQGVGFGRAAKFEVFCILFSRPGVFFSPEPDALAQLFGLLVERN